MKAPLRYRDPSVRAQQMTLDRFPTITAHR